MKQTILCSCANPKCRTVLTQLFFYILFSTSIQAVCATSFPGITEPPSANSIILESTPSADTYKHPEIPSHNYLRDSRYDAPPDAGSDDTPIGIQPSPEATDNVGIFIVFLALYFVYCRFLKQSKNN